MRVLLTVFFALCALLVAAGGAAFWWLHQPLSLSGSTVDVSIEPGTRTGAIVQAVVDAGVQTNPDWLMA